MRSSATKTTAASPSEIMKWNARGGWDYIYVATLIGLAPVTVFLMASFLLAVFLVPINPRTVPERLVGYVAFALVFCASVAALRWSIRYRKRHRTLPASLLPAEVACGVLLGAGYVLMVVVAIRHQM